MITGKPLKSFGDFGSPPTFKDDYLRDYLEKAVIHQNLEDEKTKAVRNFHQKATNDVQKEPSAHFICLSTLRPQSNM